MNGDRTLPSCPLLLPFVKLEVCGIGIKLLQLNPITSKACNLAASTSSVFSPYALLVMLWFVLFFNLGIFSESNVVVILFGLSCILYYKVNFYITLQRNVSKLFLITEL